MTTEHYLPVSLHMKSNDLSKKAFFNFDNQTFDRLWMDSIHRHIIFLYQKQQHYQILQYCMQEKIYKRMK